MAEDRLTLADVLGKEDAAGDLLREAVCWLVQQLMEGEVSSQIGAGRYERTSERTAQRNGYRTRAWDTRLGTLELKVEGPEAADGELLPKLAGAAAAGRAGADGGNRRGVCSGGEHP